MTREEARRRLIDALNHAPPNYELDAAEDVDVILALPEIVSAALGDGLRAAAAEAHDTIVRYLVTKYGDPNERAAAYYETHEGPWMRAPQLLLEARLILATALGR